VASQCRPFVETCLETFGASRCKFESNFPVDKVSYSYQVFWNACKRLVSGTSPSEKLALFGGVARRVYRLDSISLGQTALTNYLELRLASRPTPSQ
jgi:predicted TIM-barrel fold metal-dependent hydrolase